MSFYAKLFNFYPNPSIINSIDKNPSDPRPPILYSNNKPRYFTPINEAFTSTLEKLNNSIIPDQVIDNTNQITSANTQNTNSNHKDIQFQNNSQNESKIIKNSFQKFILPQIPLENDEIKSPNMKNFPLPQIESINLSKPATSDNKNSQNNLFTIPDISQSEKASNEKQNEEVPSQNANEETFILECQREVITKLMTQFRKISKDFTLPQISLQTIHPLIETQIKNQPIPQIHQISQIQQQNNTGQPNKIQPVPLIYQSNQVKQVPKIHQSDKSQPIPQIHQTNQGNALYGTQQLNQVQPMPKVYRLDPKPIPQIYQVNQHKNQLTNEDFNADNPIEKQDQNEIPQNYLVQPNKKQIIAQQPHSRILPQPQIQNGLIEIPLQPKFDKKVGQSLPQPQIQQLQVIMPPTVINELQNETQDDIQNDKLNPSPQQQIDQLNKKKITQECNNESHFQVHKEKNDKEMLNSQDQDKNKLTGRQRSLLNLKNYKGGKVKTKRQPPRKK